MKRYDRLAALILAVALLLSGCSDSNIPRDGDSILDEGITASEVQLSSSDAGPKDDENPGDGTDTPDVSGESSQVADVEAAEPPAPNNPASTDAEVQAQGEAPISGPVAVNIRVGDAVFAAQFYDNETSRAFLAQFPLTLDMDDLNRNEKMYRLPENLPTSATEQPDIIRAGEIMCYQRNYIVLFYDTFANIYGGYTRLGHIEDVTGLSDALGAGAVTVTFEVA